MDHTRLGIPGVDLCDRDVQTSGDVLNSLVALRDDAHALGDGFSSDGMVTSHHDDLDSSTPAFAHGVGHGGAGRINHRHEADEAQVLSGEVDVISVKLKAIGKLVVREVEMA